MAPPSVLTSHCTVGLGLPLAAAVKVADCPAVTVALDGAVVIAGGVCTVRRAAVVVALPTALLKTASYRLAFWFAALVKLSVPEVAPAMGV